MRRNLFYSGVIFVLLTIIAATPISVRAEGDPPPTPEPVKPPWITGVNPQVSLSYDEEQELDSSGAALQGQRLSVPLMESPSYVDLEPQDALAPSQNGLALAIPQIYQDPEDVTCGAAALSMALDFLSLNGEGTAPSQDSLVSDLKRSGLIYESGTGVEELTYLARQHGYLGTTAFHGWSLDQLGEELAAGKPVVVSLASNGENQPGHFVTLTGIADDGSWVSYNDPILGQQTLPVDDFLQAWSAQGNAGLVVGKEPLSVVNDPMLPWMGLFSALTMLTVLAKSYPLGEKITSKLADFRGLLSNPLRKGFGGKLDPGGAGSSSSPPYTAPSGYHWNKTALPKYGWKEYQYLEKVQVPNIVKTYGVIKTNTWIEKVPIYTNIKVDKGHWAYRTVKKYRTERYRTKQRYQVKKTYWYRRNGRFYRGTRYEWKTRTVVKTRRVPYNKREKYWVPKIVTEKKLVRVRDVVHRVPVYGWKEEVRGTRTIEVPKNHRSWVPVATTIDWKLKKDPVPKLTPTPTPTPTPYPERAPDPPITTPVPSTQLAASEPGLLAKIIDPLWWQEKAKQYGEKVQDQKIFSVSASDQWDINMYSQAGMIAQSTPYNMFFVNQTLNVVYKEKLTGNPGSFADVNVTSGTFTVNITENLSVFGSMSGGSTGYGVKRPGSGAHDYIVDKVSIGLTPNGPTITYRQEGVNLQLKNEEKNFETKGITTIACETHTLRTEGLVLIGGAVVLAILAGPEILALGPPVLEGLNRLIPNLIPAFGN